MGSLVRSAMRTAARQIAQDVASGTDSGLSDADYNRLLNEAIQQYAHLYPQHFIVDRETWTTTWTQGIKRWAPSTGFEVRRILSVLSTQSGLQVPLERIELSRMMAKLTLSGIPAGTPLYFAVERDSWTNGSGGVQAATTLVNAFNVWLYPNPNASHTLRMTYEFVTDTLDEDGDYPRALGDEEVRQVCRMAGYTAALINGKDDEFLDDILSGLPSPLRAQYAILRRNAAPKVRPDEVG